MKNNLRLTIALISVFIIGLGAGFWIASQSWGASQKDETAVTERHRVENGPALERGEGERRADRIRQHMKEQLGLDDEKADSLFILIRENREERRLLMQESREQFRRDMAEHHEQFHSELQTLLDERQMALWDSLYSREANQQQRRRLGRERQER